MIRSRSVGLALVVLLALLVCVPASLAQTPVADADAYLRLDQIRDGITGLYNQSQDQHVESRSWYIDHMARVDEMLVVSGDQIDRLLAVEASIASLESVLVDQSLVDDERWEVLLAGQYALSRTLMQAAMVLVALLAVQIVVGIVLWSGR